MNNELEVVLDYWCITQLSDQVSSIVLASQLYSNKARFQRSITYLINMMQAALDMNYEMAFTNPSPQWRIVGPWASTLVHV